MTAQRIRLRFVLGVLAFFLSVLNRVTQSSSITTYAGPALPVGGAPALTQSLDDPTDVATDGTGGFYVTSTSQNRVRRVNPSGVPATPSSGARWPSNPARRVRPERRPAARFVV